MTDKKIMRIELQFDISEGTASVSLFLAMMMDNGYAEQVRQCAQQLLAEAEKRNLPIADKLRAGLKAAYVDPQPS